MAGYDGKILARFIEEVGNGTNITFQLLEDAIESPSCLPFHSEVMLIEPLGRVHIPETQSFIHSFTGITKNLVVESHGSQSAPPHDFYCQQKSSFNLPAGKETGILLHKILESIPYQAVNNATTAEEILPLVKPFIGKSLFADWLGVITEIVFNALKTELRHGNESFCLCEIGLESRYHEIEFLYPNNHFAPIEEMHVEGGLIKGVIDMVCMHSGKYFVIDWKSNWLGNDSKDYMQASMSEAMTTHHYHLQASIYRSALERYLRLVDPRPFSEIFGGVYYLFLRGMHVSDERGGVYLIG